MAKKTVASATPATDDGKTDYVVTDRAPPRVAGRRITAGETVRLTEDEARSELMALHIRPAVIEATSKVV